MLYYVGRNHHQYSPTQLKPFGFSSDLYRLKESFIAIDYVIFFTTGFKSDLDMFYNLQKRTAT